MFPKAELSSDKIREVPNLVLSVWLIAFNPERLWLDGNLSFSSERGTDQALVVVMLPALEQLVPETIAWLEHAC